MNERGGKPARGGPVRSIVATRGSHVFTWGVLFQGRSCFFLVFFSFFPVILFIQILTQKWTWKHRHRFSSLWFVKLSDGDKTETKSTPTAGALKPEGPRVRKWILVVLFFFGRATFSMKPHFHPVSTRMVVLSACSLLPRAAEPWQVPLEGSRSSLDTQSWALSTCESFLETLEGKLASPYESFLHYRNHSFRFLWRLIVKSF